MSKTDITHAKVLEIKKGNAITLPGEFVDSIGLPYGLAILVLKDKNVKLYPVGSSRILYLKLNIEKLSKSFLEELTSVFEKSGLEDILFTSGICQSADQCYYECYFTPEQLNVEDEKLRKSLDGISGVQSVILEEVPIAK
ncbi:MAG: hypothetical protein JSW61_12275 [Candidatus Thorarchaeota archaeon]|nr:MAG: hypothetical protein JSW61_12275 [Candidatus Thorarchaeota archaeon]